MATTTMLLFIVLMSIHLRWRGEAFSTVRARVRWGRWNSQPSSLSSLLETQQQHSSEPSFYERLAATSQDDHLTIAQRLNVKPGMTDYSPQLWKFVWRTHGRILPLLHLFDTAHTSDLDNCLKVLWCKALIGLDLTSPAFDGGVAYDMLPSGSRLLVRLPERLFPRLVHFIIELRTVFLDRALQEEIRYAKRNAITASSCHIRLVTLGAGYDVRSVKFLNEYQGLAVDEAWELDMPQVIDSKSIMLQRLQSRRPNTKVPNLLVQDLTDFDGLKQQLSKIISNNNTSSQDWHTVFVVEGVLIYMKEKDRSQVLSICSEVLVSANKTGSFLFSDRIRKLRDPDTRQIESWLQSDGWKLANGSFYVHPGKARHMGAARVVL